METRKRGGARKRESEGECGKERKAIIYIMPRYTSSLLTRLALGFQVLIVFLSLSGIAVNLWLAPTTSARLNSFSYYTIQSNLLVAAALLLGMRYLWSGKPEPQGLVVFKSGALLWILVTGIVFALLLSGLWQPQGAMAYVNLSLHYLAPAGMLLKWLLFEPKGRYKLSYLPAWMSYPLAYVIFSWLRGAVTGFYPYWFLNPNDPYPQGAGSIGGMLAVFGVLVVGFILVSLLILLIDRLPRIFRDADER
jgi:hypothetical protein